MLGLMVFGDQNQGAVFLREFTLIRRESLQDDFLSDLLNNHKTEDPADSDEIEKRNVNTIKDFRALGQVVDMTGAQVVFCSVPFVAEKNDERSRRTHIINKWLEGWCHQQDFGFFDHGASFMAPALLEPDGIHLSVKGRRFLAHEFPPPLEEGVEEIDFLKKNICSRKDPNIVLIEGNSTDCTEVVTKETQESATVNYHYHGKRALIHFQGIHKDMKGF
ncbi:hypothetical protein DUI87_03908 [Hirundo rustica rustica]|uniref:SGNH hydrolase-type esterase domain-containing protein n=1 Tax=Hirundo rustica rustica TaxID=333673 RepID=A0A3M0L2Q5_HIRRU|nr:hypothetical protein DUI87_03908 [Hirundo rustica rustica]